MSQQTYFYPAASFPSQNDKVRYDIEGSLVPEPPVLAPRPNPHPDEIPEVKPANAPPLNVPLTVPVATPAPGASVASDTSNSSTTTTTTTTSSTSQTPGGVNSITAQEAIIADQKRDENHPDIAAITTSTPSTVLPDVKAASLTAPMPSSDTQTTMSTKPVQSTVQVMDSVTDPNAVKN